MTVERFRPDRVEIDGVPLAGVDEVEISIDREPFGAQVLGTIAAAAIAPSVVRAAMDLEEIRGRARALGVTQAQVDAILEQLNQAGPRDLAALQSELLHRILDQAEDNADALGIPGAGPRPLTPRPLTQAQVRAVELLIARSSEVAAAFRRAMQRFAEILETHGDAIQRLAETLQDQAEQQRRREPPAYRQLERRRPPRKVDAPRARPPR